MSDPYSFTNSYEKLLDNQKSNILRACLHFERPYIIRYQFKNYHMEFTQSSQVTTNENEKLKTELCNIKADKKRYEQVRSFRRR